MLRLRHPIATCSAILCAIALAGCGGANATAEFRAGYSAARGPLNRTYDQAYAALTSAGGKSAARITGTFGVLADRFGTELHRLESLKPPPAVMIDFTTLTSSLGRVEGDIRAIELAVRQRDFSSAQQAGESLTSDGRAATLAATAITQKIDIG